IRTGGAPNAVIAHDKQGRFDIPALLKQAQEWSGLEGLDLAKAVTRDKHEGWEGGPWTLGQGYQKPSPLQGSPHPPTPSPKGEGEKRPHVVAIDYGSKDNIFRNLVKAGARVTVVPAQTSPDEGVALEPDGGFLPEGPARPAATRREPRP